MIMILVIIKFHNMAHKKVDGMCILHNSELDIVTKWKIFNAFYII